MVIVILLMIQKVKHILVLNEKVMEIMRLYFLKLLMGVLLLKDFASTQLVKLVSELIV